MPLTWRQTPLYLLVYEELRRLVAERKSAVTDEDLYNAVRQRARSLGFDVSFSDILKALMILEVHGLVHVESRSEKADKGRIIELLAR